MGDRLRILLLVLRERERHHRERVILHLRNSVRLKLEMQVSCSSRSSYHLAEIMRADHAYNFNQFMVSWPLKVIFHLG